MNINSHFTTIGGDKTGNDKTWLPRPRYTDNSIYVGVAISHLLSKLISSQKGKTQNFVLPFVSIPGEALKT